MQFKRKISTINYINLIWVLFLFLFKYIFCECTNNCLHEAECVNECKTSIYGDSFFCRGLTSSNDKYFYVYHYYENDKQCHLIDKCPDKVVASSNECVLECLNYYEIGDFCFEEIEHIDNYIPVIVIGNKKKYKCKDYTYIKIIDGKDYHICIDDPQNPPLEDRKVNNICPSLYYDSDEMKCVDSCKNKVIIKQNGKNKDGQHFLYYECKNDCKLRNGEGNLVSGFEYNESYDIAGSTNIYCLDECPYKTPFYYELSGQSKKCQKDCKQNHFYDDTNKCFSQCDGENKLYLYDDLKNYFYCFNKEESPVNGCKNTHPYKYQNACLRSCRDTQLNQLINKKTYLYNKNNENICVDNCFNQDNLFYEDDDSLLCVDDCKKTKNKFHYNHKCVHSCTSYTKYYKQTSLDSSDNPNDFECVDDCPGGYIYNNICLEKCPKSSNMPYIDLEKKKCSECKIPKNPSDPQLGEGYIVNSEFEEKKGINVICRKSCPSGTYYKSKDNICYDLITDIKDECYFSEDDFNICYPSCKDIPGGQNLNENKINGKNICYKELDCGNQFFYINDNIKRCIDNVDNNISNRPKYVRECSKLDFNYLRDKQCIDKCEEDEYKIEPESTIYDRITVLGKCCNSPDCDSNYPYYSESDKILKKDCNLKLIEKRSENIIKSSQGNCVSECPEDYPFESEDGNFCLFTCPKNYFMSGTTKKCIDDCKNIGKFYFEGEKECVDSCSKKISNQLTNYYYDSDNICRISCKAIEKFSLEATDSPQKCLIKCPDSKKYYFESNNICLPSCNKGFYKSENENICVTQCESKQFVINDNICNNNCTDKEPFIVSATIDSTSIVYNKCVNSCFGENSIYKYYHYDTKNCLETCPPDAPYKYEEGKICYKTCPEELYTELNECKLKCDSYKYYVKDGNSYKCVDICSHPNIYISSTGECVENCKFGEHFIGKNNKCKSLCDEEEDGKFYKNAINIASEDGNILLYKIYLCKKTYGTIGSGEDTKRELLVYKTNEIVDNECPENEYLSENGNICYSKCNIDGTLPFSTEDNDGKKICFYECKGDKKYFGEDKVCSDNCGDQIINDEDNSCVSKCNESSLYKYLTKKEDNGVERLHCSKKCEEPTTKYSEKEKKCVEKCSAPENLIFENNCLDKCPQGLFAVKNKDNNYNEYFCKEKCEGDDLYYYEKDRKCISKNDCKDYIIPETNECISNCSSKNYYFYDYDDTNDEIDDETSKNYDHNTCVRKCPEDKPFLRENNHCFEECNINSFVYYEEEDKKCLEKCPKGKFADGFVCKAACPSDKFLDTKNNSCINNCLFSNNRYLYYAPPNNTCIENCDEYLYIDDYKCVNSCPTDGNKYAEMGKCTEKCSNIRNYVVEKFTHGEKDTQQKCLESCPEDYPYYITKNGINNCVGTCSYYILPANNKIKSIQCFENKCENNYKYFIKYENGTNQCLLECPKEFPFYIPNIPEEEGKNIQCYQNCPKEKPFHKAYSYECINIEECDSKTIDYDSNECVSSCTFSQLKGKKDEINYCLSKCNKEIGEFQFGNECVEICDSDKYLIPDYVNKKCICKNLFYKIDSGDTICIDPSIQSCEEYSKINTDYKYRIYNTYECSKYCFGYLSPSQDICYLNITNCEEIDINTELVIENPLRCDCKYKFYQYKTAVSVNSKKICLGKNEECNLPPYLMYTPKTKECVVECEDPYKISFENQCFEKCPIISKEDSTSNDCKCETNEYLTKIGEERYKCTENACPEDFPFLIQTTKECVKKCLGTGYEVMYKNQCYLSCSSLPGMKQIKIEDEKLKEIALYTCQCETLWYYDNGEIVCPTESQDIINKCSEINNKNFKYLIKETNECVANCPNNYFNDECFKSCEDAKNTYQYPVKQYGNSKECICENIWERIGENKEKVVCLKDITCKNLMVNETKECVDECPEEFPLEFNKKCYKRGNCPDGTIEDILEGKNCNCKNFWLRQENGNIYCINGDKCPDTHPYKIVSTKECTTTHCKDTEFKKIFNYECYENCPDGKVNKKIINEEGVEIESDECECNPQYGYWYIEGKEKPMMICEKSACPETMIFIKNGTKQCLSSCSKNNLYRLDKICYEKECPYPTVSENIITNKYECTTKKYTTATNLDDSLKFIKAEIVELYKSVPKGGIIFNKFSSTMQIYGIKKENSDSKDFLRSTLSYIDLGSCKDKVYENNKMKPDDDIIVVKYDLEKQVPKSLVKSVEYEFINSRNGQVLDMSVCKKDEVLISYSLSNILNYSFQSKKRNLDPEDEENEPEIEESEISEETKKIILEIQKQYNKGKEIYLKYNIDTFNINSSIYNDMCFSFPIEGKDLVLEDRVKYFYPFYSLCEANCTYSSTDFEFERIYCNCPLKKELDFNREQKFVINQNNIDEIRSKQKGPSNVPVMECLSSLGKKGVSNNGAFFYSLIIMILEVGLIIITIFYSFKKLKRKINRNSYNNKEKENEFEEKKKVSGRNNKNNEIIYKNSERALQAPPKKGENDLESIDPNDIKLENKYIKTKIDNKENDGMETEDPRTEGDEENNYSFAKEYELGILNEIKKEAKLLRIKYELSIQKDKSDIFIILLTEVCEKIYLFKTLFLLGKYDMFTIYLSLYLLYHLLLLSMVNLFYDIKTIQNIWNKENYPGLNFDLGYGLLAALVIWVLYRIFLCLLNNDNVINKYFKKHIATSISSENDDLKENNKLLNNLMRKIRNGMITYFVIEFIFLLVCLLYLTSFAAVYVGTKAKVFKTYGIALTEVLILKILYGLILGILRKVGLYKKKKVLYNVAYYFDKFIY